MRDVKQIATNFLKEMICAHVNGAKQIGIESLVEPVSPFADFQIYLSFHSNLMPRIAS